MKKFSEIKEEAERCSKIDKSNLGEESLKVSSDIQRFIQYGYEYRIALEKISQEKKKIYQELHDYYSGKKVDGKEAYPFRILKSEISSKIEVDPEYQAINEKYQRLKICLLFIEETLQNLKQKTWNIKNMIEFQKFISGA